MKIVMGELLCNQSLRGGSWSMRFFFFFSLPNARSVSVSLHLPSALEAIPRNFAEVVSTLKETHISTLSQL